MTGDSTIVLLAATLLGAAAFAYLSVIEARRAYQRGVEREAYLTGIERGMQVRRRYPLAPAPRPPADMPSFNPHLPRTRRLLCAAECRAAHYADGYFCGWFREELADLDRLPVTKTRERAA